jgi:uncharacterized protein YbjT (DUF2867 family)
MGMKIVIVGANGKIGRQLVQLFAGTEHQVRAMIRNEEQASELKRLGADEIVVADLEKEIDHAIKGCSAVVFTAGSGSHTGPDKTELVDKLGAIKTIEKAEAFGVERFIMVSSIYADRPDAGPERIRHYFVAKGVADDRLRASKLNYTIIRPGYLTNDPPKGTVRIGEHIEESGEIPRGDVARTIVEALENEHTYRRSFDLQTGETPIAEALRSL